MVAAIVLAGVTIGLLAARHPPAPAPQGGPRAATASELRELAADSTRPLYWAGDSAAGRLELTRARGGAVYLRYLSSGTRIGDRRPAFTTVATYPMRSAYAVSRRSSRRPGLRSASVPGGGLAVWRARPKTSVYLAYPGDAVLVEVFSPVAGEALRLARSGGVGPVR